MIEFTLPGKYNTVIECCERYIGPRKYYLHNKVGGNGWEVSHSSDLSDGFRAKLKVVNDIEYPSIKHAIESLGIKHRATFYDKVKREIIKLEYK